MSVYTFFGTKSIKTVIFHTNFSIADEWRGFYAVSASQLVQFVRVRRLQFVPRLIRKTCLRETADAFCGDIVLC